MSKLTIFLALAAIVCYANAHHDSLFDDDWFKDFPTMKPIVVPTMKPVTKDDIKNLHPEGDNSHVQGSYTSHSSSKKTVNGEVVEDKNSSDAVYNDQGNVTEYSSGN